MNLITYVKKAQSWRLFARHDDVRTTFAIVRWWESRRLPYNLIVGVTGVATCVIGLTIAIIGSRMSHQPILFPNPPLFAAFAVIGYGVMANVCFTGVGSRNCSPLRYGVNARLVSRRSHSPWAYCFRCC